MTRRTEQRPRHQPVPDPGPHGARPLRWGVLLGLASLAIAGGLWWWRSDDGVGKVRGIERALLAGELSGRAGKRAVDEIVRTVDRMQPEEVQRVKQTLEDEWRRLCQEDIDAFRIAAFDEQTAILDRSIQRGLTYQELLFAVNPRASSKNYRRPRKPQRAAAESRAANGGDEAARQDRDRFRNAVLQRARERRIDVPVWQ